MINIRSGRMRIFFSIILVSIPLSKVCAQNKLKNIVLTTEEKFFKMRPDICPFDLRLRADEVSCSDFGCEGKVVEIAFSYLINFYSDSSTTEYLKKFDQEVENLVKLAGCTNTKNILLHVPIGAFIHYSEGYEYYDENFVQKTTKLNLSRFASRYGEKLSNAFKNQKIYVIEHDG